MNQPKQVDYAQRIGAFLHSLSVPFRELYKGYRTGSIPWKYCISATLAIQICLSFRLDLCLFKRFGMHILYPRVQWLYVPYYYLLLFSPLIAWGFFRAIIAANLKKRLSEVFRAIGLQNRLGKLPNLICDLPLDDATRKLRLSMSALSFSEFQRAKPSLESALHVFIDEIRENRVKGAVDIIYSHSPMPDAFTIKEYKNYHPSEFTIGTTRAKIVRANITDVPHFLIAGQTGGGKSTFLRHFITSLYLSDKNARFTLIDLKGGLEFQLFENLKRVVVTGEMADAVGLLQEIDEKVKSRMRLLKDHKCKDIREYQKSHPGRAKDLPREIIVVDEAAELFLSSALASADKVRTAKEILSRIARQGRSLGIHLVIATQRPDSRALDPQIKANLPGVLCFQMVNDISSITVLGNGRATDLPPIPGRGIWKSSLEIVEVQTPNLPTDRAETLLAPHRIENIDPVEPIKTTPPPSNPTNTVRNTADKDI